MTPAATVASIAMRESIAIRLVDTGFSKLVGVIGTAATVSA
jgi:hypothetical protein